MLTKDKLKLSTRFIFIILTTLSCFAFAQPHNKTFYFYQGISFGSEALFNPIRVIINGGFGIMQISNRSNNLNSVDLENGFKNVTYNLSHPFKTISQSGWKKFLTREVISTSTS